MSCHQYLNTDQVLNLFDESNRKRHFIGPDQKADFTKIWSALYYLLAQSLILFKNILLLLKVCTLNQFVVNNQFPRIKACAKPISSKNAQNRRKMDKIGNASLFFSIVEHESNFWCLSQELVKILLQKQIHKEKSNTCWDILKTPKKSWISCIPPLH